MNRIFFKKEAISLHWVMQLLCAVGLAVLMIAAFFTELPEENTRYWYEGIPVQRIYKLEL